MGLILYFFFFANGLYAKQNQTVSKFILNNNMYKTVEVNKHHCKTNIRYTRNQITRIPMADYKKIILSP